MPGWPRREGPPRARGVEARVAPAKNARPLPRTSWEGGLGWRLPQWAARLLHPPGTLLGRPPSAALLGPCAPALTLHRSSIRPMRVEDRFVDIVAEGLDAGIRLTDDLLSHDCICIRSPTTSGIHQWELERGPRSWRVPVRGPVITSDSHLLLRMAEVGVGLAYTFEPMVTEELRRGTLRLVLEPYAAWVPGLFLYFPSRAQVSPALRAFVDVAARRRPGRSGRPREKHDQGPLA
ncbi:LysR substrate-binding domain-containing protein [Archangium minus]|uniref:LysR substrate-binding domain-containing protein n=1 Tax=Archangium minus TaxID=83450 RepID=UPI0037BF67DD